MFGAYGQQQHSLFAGLGNAPIFERGEYMQPGWYDLTVKRCLVKRTQRSNKPGYIVEFEVIASSVDAHPSGHSVTWFQDLSDPKIGHPALKQYLAALLGFQTSDTQAIAHLSTLAEPIAEWSISARNVLAGWSVRTVNEMIMTQAKPGKPSSPFTRHNFQPFPYEVYSMGRPDIGELTRTVMAGPPPVEQPAAQAPNPWGQPQMAPQQWGPPPGQLPPPQGAPMPAYGAPQPTWQPPAQQAPQYGGPPQYGPPGQQWAPR